MAVLRQWAAIFLVGWLSKQSYSLPQPLVSRVIGLPHSEQSELGLDGRMMCFILLLWPWVDSAPFWVLWRKWGGRIRSGNRLPWTHRTPGGLARNHLHILFFYYPVQQKRGAGVKRIPSEESGRRNVWGPKWRAFRAGSLLSVRLRMFQAMLARLLCKLGENSRPQNQCSLNLSKPS